MKITNDTILQRLIETKTELIELQQKTLDYLLSENDRLTKELKRTNEICTDLLDTYVYKTK